MIKCQLIKMKKQEPGAANFIIYGHLYPSRHEEVADRLEQLVSKNKTKTENSLLQKDFRLYLSC
ncbi:hypothetical protein D3Z53_11555 [Lachnospiraceae bacterium]|nr:hypothetical protein [Lachnospiraceae bacterium]